MHRTLGVRLGETKLGETELDETRLGIIGAGAKLAELRMCEDIDVIPSASGAQGLPKNVLTPEMD